MRVFSASLATETNTFAPMPTGLRDFEERALFRAGQHPDAMQMFAGPLWAAREIGTPLGWTLIEGLVAAAVPSGVTTRAAYEQLRDMLLDDLRAAMPIDMVLLGLHGAMVAEGYPDCEGDLLARVREMVGPDGVIGATLDPHAHLSDAMVRCADLLICWKEYPHTDILDRARELVTACAAIRDGRIAPRASVADTGMVAMFHTTREPARGFVDRLHAIEARDDIVSASIVHGFGWGDVPAMGTRVLIYRDVKRTPNAAVADTLAEALAADLFEARAELTIPSPGIDAAIDMALAERGTVVLADIADNAGGGAPSDSTHILRRLIEREVRDVCLGPIWDPGAVRIAMEAGEGGRLPIRVGGKVSPLSGQPLDATWTVSALRCDVTIPGLPGTRARLGDCALIECDGIAVVINTIRCQGFSTELFTTLGCDPALRRIVVVKSAQHFVASFARISDTIVYVDAPGVFAQNIAQLDFTNVSHPRWPLTVSPN